MPRALLLTLLPAAALAQLSTGSLGPKSLPRSLPAPAAEGGLKLDARWDSPNALIPRGPHLQRKEFHRLLTGFATPGTDPSPAPGTTIYRAVTYLMPVDTARAHFGLTSAMGSGGQPSFAGFPAGLKFTAYSASPGRSFEVRLVHDQAAQLAAVEFAAPQPANLPPLPPRPPDRSFIGRYYDFLPRGDTAIGQGYTQAVWDMRDHVIIATRGGPKAANLYLPKPLVRLILHCLDLPAK